jgi:hypothetical protein
MRQVPPRRRSVSALGGKAGHNLHTYGVKSTAHRKAQTVFHRFPQDYYLSVFLTYITYRLIYARSPLRRFTGPLVRPSPLGSSFSRLPRIRCKALNCRVFLTPPISARRLRLCLIISILNSCMLWGAFWLLLQGKWRRRAAPQRAPHVRSAEHAQTHLPLSPALGLPEAASRRRIRAASHPPTTKPRCRVTSWLLYMSYGAQLGWAGAVQICARKNSACSKRKDSR